MDAAILPSLLFWAFILPIAVGFAGSFWLAGRGNRLIWIVPSLLVWYTCGALIIRLQPQKITMFWVLSEWINAGMLISSGYVFRRWRNRNSSSHNNKANENA